MLSVYVLRTYLEGAFPLKNWKLLFGYLAPMWILNHDWLTSPSLMRRKILRTQCRISMKKSKVTIQTRGVLVTQSNLK